MITTVDTKREQLQRGYFQCGNGSDHILMVGSCRMVPYLNYLIRANQDSRFTIRYIDPFSWNWNEREELVCYEEKINSMEADSRILESLKATSVFIHEYYKNFGMFNTDRNSAKNIYQFGLNPRMDILIPNFHDVFVLGQPKELGESELEKFYSVCRKTSFPEMEHHFRDNWRATRFFWTHNHVSRHFTLFIFKMMNDRFLNLDIGEDFWNQVEREDLFANTPGEVSQSDRDNYQLEW